MNGTANDDTAIDITSTLINALTQSQTLVRQLEESSRTIEQLRRENERLRHDLEAVQTAEPVSEGSEQISEQFDQFFKKDAEKQAAIDDLKKQLHVLQKKERKWRTQNPQIPSPLVSSDEPDSIPSSSPLRSPLFAAFHGPPRNRASSPSATAVVQQPSSPPRKRPRPASSDGQPLQELSNNQKAERKATKGKDRASRGAEAIPIVTEDGEDHNRVDGAKLKEHKPSEKRDTTAFRRLDALLTTPSHGNSALSRPEHRSSKSASPAARPNFAPSLRKSSSDLARDAVMPQERPKSRFLPPRPRPAPGPEDDEPLRSRPVGRLNLSHFRLNPNVNNGYGFAYDETVRNRAERKCLPGCTRPECCGGQMEALAATLGPDAQVSDDDLLIYLLGSGSEDKIRALTSVARENLLHEARAKRVADAYGKMHRNLHQRSKSPSGFWNVDMPGSQEDRKHREEAKQRERHEVEKRYQEACKERGKWLFADE